MNIVFMSTDALPSTLWARDLYDQMHIRSDFRKWFPRMCQYGFIEGRDYEYGTHLFSVRSPASRPSHGDYPHQPSKQRKGVESRWHYFI